MIKLPEYIQIILSRLESAGEEAYVVGGSLRDALLGLEPHDYDVATSALPEKTARVFSDMRVIETGLKHGTLTVMSDSHPIEITTFRIDGSYTDSRHPESVSFTRKISEDLSRRDFTVNAMAYSEARGLIDVFGGRADLEARLIRAVRDPRERFEEDALRILRAFRFSAQLGFEIDGDTLAACGEKREGISKLSAERICAELFKLLVSKSPESSLLQMKELGILGYIFGEYSPSDRIIELVSKMQNECASRLGFLLCEADEESARNILNFLKCSNKQKATALAVRRGSAFSVREPKDAGRLAALSGDYSPFALRASVILGISPPDAEVWFEESRAPRGIGDLAISGRDIMALGGKGAQIGKTLDALFEMAVDSPQLNEREALVEEAKKILAEAHKSGGKA